MVEIDRFRNELGAVHRDQVCCAVDCVNVDDSKVLGAIFTNAQLHHPHASNFICTVTNFVEPLDESTRTLGPVVVK